MRNIQAIADKTAISLSVICTIHCLAIPIMVTLLPSLTALSLENEIFHIWLLIAVVPTSLYALTLGCGKHRRYRVLLPGVVGLVTLIATGLLGHDILGEIIEKSLTVVGASLVAIGHLWNHNLCQRSNCECHQQASS